MTPRGRFLTRRRVALLLPAMGAAATAAAIPAGDNMHRHGHGASVPEPSGFREEMDRSMADMMHAMHAPGYSGVPDVDFLVMMVPHHQGAVDMARLVLQHGRDPVTRQLAADIIAGQTVEIDSMQRRLALLRKEVCADATEFPSLGGTRGP
jgi:uncharacterized protein (DUF305 family)